MAGDGVAFETAVLVPSQQELQLETVPLAVAAFPNKVGTLLIKALGSVAPLADHKHLKRVRKAPDDGTLLEVILCTLDDGFAASDPAASAADAAPAQAAYDAPIADLDPGRVPEALRVLYSQHGGQRLRLIYGAAAPPQTRQQWDAWTKLWPITWRIPDNGTPVTEETPVDARTQQYFESHMRAALQLASQSGVDNAALLVDPAAQAPVAEAADRSAAHPLQHAVMAAVQAASERDLAQWPLEETGGDSFYGSGGGSGGGGSAGDPMDAAAVGAGGTPEEAGAQRVPYGESHPSHGPDAGVSGEATGPSDPGEDTGEVDGGLASKRPRLGAGPEEEARGLAASRPYMCTGYDCFVVREPCIMCAMALVHSRVQRVIYCRPDTTFGALGGCRRLHACKSLNHSYGVYRLELKRHQ